MKVFSMMAGNLLKITAQIAHPHDAVISDIGGANLEICPPNGMIILLHEFKG
jgi:hypothetical protein